MSSLYTEKEIEVEATAGTHIKDAAQDAIQLASFLDCMVILIFNGSRLFVDRRRTVDSVVSSFHDYRINNGLQEVISFP